MWLAHLILIIVYSFGENLSEAFICGIHYVLKIYVDNDYLYIITVIPMITLSELMFLIVITFLMCNLLVQKKKKTKEKMFKKKKRQNKKCLKL